ncbi:MAG: hypothetical protein D6814_17955 [Calditrichaeota bacterium]|nr:MAG: hypothetical protein D6814_17955 [Calditrichota bacterium]
MVFFKIDACVSLYRYEEMAMKITPKIHPGLSAWLLIFALVATGNPTMGRAMPPARLQQKKISLQFRNTDIHDVLKTLAREGKINIISSKAVKGTVTIFMDDISVIDALSLLVEMQGLAYYKERGVIKVVTAREYQQRFGKTFKPSVTTRVVRLKYAKAEQAAKSIFQLKSKEGNVIADPRSNSLILVDYPRVIRDMLRVIQQVDVRTVARTFALTHVSVQSVGEVVKQMISSGGKMTVDAGTNQLMVIDTPERIRRVEAFLEQTDVPGTAAMHVYSLQYADPEAVSKQIQGELTPGVGSVFADKSTKQLFIRDLPDNLPYLEKLIAALDKKTRQVLIEAKILQINLNDNFKMGVNWNALVGRLNGINVSSNFKVLGDSDPKGQISATGITSGPHTLSILLEALRSVGKTELLSNPRITCVDGQEARILVGSTIPYKTFDFREDQGVLKTFEKVVTVEVGVKLKVTPVINEDGFITMRIRPEVSDVTSFIDNLPLIEKSESETTVLVKDGVTIIIGGLIKDQTIENVDKVPLLGSLPILGIPFRKTVKSKIKTELVILLRPQIISGEVDMGALPQKYRWSRRESHRRVIR